jgi:LuxR family transcriptional regulator, maltose regulon positive regulatory protein
MQLQDPLHFAASAQGLTPDPQMVGGPAMEPFVSLVVVRDGVAEAFLLEPPTPAALDHGAAAVSAAITGARDSSSLVDATRLFSSPGLHGSASLEDPVRASETGVSLISKLVSLLGAGKAESSSRGEQEEWLEELTEAESRVLRYLPSNLTAWEIADELCVSLNTVKTHMRHIYAKLDAHRRREAVERARALGLLSLASHRRPDANALA